VRVREPGGPQVGKAITEKYLRGALKVLNTAALRP
jgi:hypothetical protein